MDLGLSGKRALVLSSSRGIGLGIAQALADEGASVLMTGRNETRLKSEVDAINRAGNGEAFCVSGDLSTSDCRARVVEAADKVLGGVDILVNNTGGPPPRLAADVSADDWRCQMEAMLIPVTEVTRHILPAMRQRRWGRIISVVSSGVVQPLANLATSNALRSAIVGWSKTLSAELAGNGVTVNVLLPGRIHTERIDELDGIAARNSGRSIDEVVAVSKSGIPVGRYGSVEEFAAVAAFLASRQASYVTGSAIRIDGGLIRSV